jgi:glycine/D-amino acid oxidase-like deaminating enzyme
MAIDLQSGQSYWLLLDHDLPAYPELDADEHTQVLIVGAGATGALAAALLAEAGIDVVIVDSRALACGSTGASTALLSYEPDLSLTRLGAMRGHDAAVRAYQLSRDANRELGAMVHRLGIHCGYETASSFHLARTADQAGALVQEHTLRNRAGFECNFASTAALAQDYGLIGAAALISDEAAQLDPVRLTAGCLDFAIQRGARCYRARVTRFERNDADVSALTQSGRLIDADHIVFATGYETQQRLREPGVALTSTYAIASDAQPVLHAWLRRSILWDMDEPYHYLRSTNGCVLVGGEDEPFVDERARDALMPEKTAALQQYLARILPDLADSEVVSAWCGTFAKTADGLGYIGEHDGAYYTLGYGGNGITFGMLGAMFLRDRLLNKPHDGEALFAFGRLR